MRVEFIREPFQAGWSLPGLLRDADMGKATHALVASAWLREAGLWQVESSLRAIAARGCVAFLVGVDFASTTWEGVHLARRISEQNVRVFHDARRTFHPKVYLAWNADTAWLFIGSNNLTSRGVEDNFETGIGIRCHASEAVVADVKHWYADLAAAEGRCHLVTDEVLARLRLPSEADVRERRDRYARERAAHGDAGGGASPDLSLFWAPAWPALRPPPGSGSGAPGSGLVNVAGSGGPGGSDQAESDLAAGAARVGLHEGAPERLRRYCPPPRRNLGKSPQMVQVWKALHAEMMSLEHDLGWHYSSPNSTARRTYYWAGLGGLGARDSRLWFLSGDVDYVVANCYGWKKWEDIRMEERLPEPEKNYVKVGTHSMEEVPNTARILSRIYQRLRFEV